MADRVRSAPARKRTNVAPRKKRRKQRPGIFLRIIFLAGLAVLILGFLTKRVLIPSAVHYIAYRPPPNDAAVSNVKSNKVGDGGSEQLTTDDRDQLNAVLKDKNK